MTRCDGANGEVGYVLSCWAEGSSGGATPRSLPSDAGTSLYIFGRAAHFAPLWRRVLRLTCASGYFLTVNSEPSLRPHTSLKYIISPYAGSTRYSPGMLARALNVYSYVPAGR